MICDSGALAAADELADYSTFDENDFAISFTFVKYVFNCDFFSSSESSKLLFNDFMVASSVSATDEIYYFTSDFYSGAIFEKVPRISDMPLASTAASPSDFV